MQEDKTINDLMKRIKRTDRTVNKIAPFMPLIIFIVSIVNQYIRMSNNNYKRPEQFCLLPIIIIPSIALCIGVFKREKFNKYLVFSVIFNVLGWVLMVVSIDFVMPTYLYGLHKAEILVGVCFLSSIITAVSIITKWKPFIKASLIFSMVAYIGVIIYAAITQPTLSQIQNEMIYYGAGYVFYYMGILFNINRIGTKEEIDIINEDWDEFPELYKTDETLIDPIQTIFEVYMLRNLYEQQLESGIEYNIFYKAITEEGRYLDYMLENNLFGKEFIDEMIENFLKFKSMCSEGIDDTSEKLKDFFKALKDIQECMNQEERDRKIYCLLMMVRADRRYFTKEE